MNRSNWLATGMARRLLALLLGALLLGGCFGTALAEQGTGRTGYARARRFGHGRAGAHGYGHAGAQGYGDGHGDGYGHGDGHGHAGARHADGHAADDPCGRDHARAVGGEPTRTPAVRTAATNPRPRRTRAASGWSCHAGWAAGRRTARCRRLPASAAAR